jgi:2,4-dienoyl-CoA reductase-like NADH-dependent reductase (Old Yellow Enzyme family)
MGILFTPFTIRGLTLRNRIVRSATYDGGAEHGGFVSKWQIDLYSTLARGQVGLIVSGIFNVDSIGKASPFHNSIQADRFIEGLMSLTNAVHEHGSKIAVQLFHGGREVFRRQEALGRRALGPSTMEPNQDPYFKGSCRAMADEEIEATIEAFGAAAGRVKEAGCDAVQVHGAHAYLFSQFLSPQSNKRKDKWGGSLENRLRLHKMVYQAVRKAVGQKYPVMIKLGVEDGFSGGLKFEEGLEAAIQLAESGYDAIEVSQGLRGHDYAQAEFRPKIVRREREAYFRTWCRQVKTKIGVPVIMVGGLRSRDLMEEIVSTGEADLVALCRPLIREPDLIASWSAGKERRATCISCNGCFDLILTGARLRCVVGEEDEAKVQRSGPI